MLQMRKPKQKMKRAGPRPRAGSRRKPAPLPRRKPSRARETPSEAPRESPRESPREPPPDTAHMASPVRVVTVRALKADLKGFLDKARSGDVLVIVERKTPIAFIIPPSLENTQAARAGLERLAAKGLVTLGRGGPLTTFEPVRVKGSTKLTSEMVIEDRKDRC